MRKHIQAFIQTAAEAFELQGPVYKFGYCRNLVPAAESTCAEGVLFVSSLPNSDDGEAEFERLEDFRNLPFPDGSARTVVCIDTLEHLFDPARAIEEMTRILAPGGMLLVCSSTDGPTGQPGLHWQLTPQTLQRMLAPLDATLVGWQGHDESPHTLLAVGCKSPVPDTLLQGLNHFIDRFQARLDEVAAQRSWREQLRWLLASCLLLGKRPSPAAHARQPRFLLHLPLGRQSPRQLLPTHASKQNAGGRLDCHG